MTREDWLRGLIGEQYKNLFHFSRQIQMPHSTLRRILSPGGVDAASFGNLEKICCGLGVTVADLQGLQSERTDMPLVLTDTHEKAVMEAYRKRTELQPIVDRVLEV